MSYFKREYDASKPARKPAAKAAKNWATKPLNKDQKSTLIIAGKEAYNIQSEHGLTRELSFDDWRREQVHIAVQKAGLRECTNQHFRAILARFYRLAGRENEAAALYAKTGRVKGSEESGDTIENREVSLVLIQRLITESEGKINAAYVADIVFDKHQGKAIDQLTASELQKLVFTITDRLSKKE